MKLRTLTAALLFALLPGEPPAGLAQDPGLPPSSPPVKPPRNPIEEFVSRKGVVIVKRMYAIKTFSWGGPDEAVALAVSAMHAYDAEKKAQGVFAVRFEGQPRGGTSVSAFLDLASARALVAGLESMIAKGRETASESPEFLEIRFALGDSLECGFTQQATAQRPFVMLGADVIRTIRSSRMADLEDLKVSVALEIERLRQLGAN
jgi:hypothetical protein